MLPVDTFLGKLELFEIYDDFEGPKCFSVINNLKQIYFVYWAGFIKESCTDTWVYSSISEKRLDRVRRQEESVRSVFIQPELNVFYVAMNHETSETDVSFVARDKVVEYNIPPECFEIEADEIEVIAEEPDWHFELKIQKRSDKHAFPDRNMVTKVIDAFSEIIESLMNDETRKVPKVYPKSAVPGSFEVKLETNDNEKASDAIIKFNKVISNVDELDTNLKSAVLDPYRVKELLEIIQQHNLRLIITPKTYEFLSESIKIEKNAFDGLIELLDKSTAVLVDSALVPQANNLERVIQIVQMRSRGEPIHHDYIDGINSKRQVQYHTDAAFCLGLLKKNLSITSAGQFLVSKEDKSSQYEYLADRFESSEFGWAWIKWSGVNNMLELESNTAKDFINECVAGLNQKTSARRSSTLAKWLGELKPYRRNYSNQAKSQD